MKIQYIFYEGWPWKVTYLPTGEKFFVYYEIATTKIEVKQFPLMPE